MVWLSVRVQLMNQNEYPAQSEAVLAALPIRATRVLRDGSHTAFFNSKAEDAMRAISHKV
jgi:chemotaxis methyl-accepting protein methylase